MTGPFHFWPSFHIVALLQSTTPDFNDFVLSRVHKWAGKRLMWMQKPLLSMHVSCVNLGLQLVLFFLQAVRSEKHKVAVKASNPSGQMFVCSLLLCVPVCVYERETERERRKRIYYNNSDQENWNRTKPGEKHNHINVWEYTALCCLAGFLFSSNLI